MSSSESSTILVKARPMLSDMPYNIKELIAENTDIKTRYTLRKVSTHFRAAVDTSQFWFEEVLIRISNQGKLFLCLTPGQIFCAETTIVYRKNGENGCVVEKDGDRRERAIEGEDFIQTAVNDLGIILKSPKGCVMWMAFKGSKVTNVRLVHCLQETFGSFRHKLSVFGLAANLFRKQDHVLQLLGLLKPGDLKNLYLKYLRENCDRIVETEHWPLLEEAHVGDIEGAPISKFLHMREFKIKSFPLTKDDVEQIVQSILQRPDNFEEYEFCTFDEAMDSIWEEALSNYWPARPKIPIPGTNYQLEIIYGDLMISFLKTIR